MSAKTCACECKQAVLELIAVVARHEQEVTDLRLEVSKLNRMISYLEGWTKADLSRARENR